ncbi:MAG: hypothetical protein WA989_03000, partial [Henriciella sp.]|uniref:hypothetical protein n=1 Tax=Henriciella sp. TaxID=1968823 RepID=UPI003C713553
YEDRTLFPTPIQERQREAPQDVKTGLSAAGVLMVAAVAAAIAGAIVWAVLTFAGPQSPGSTGPSPEMAELRQENERLASIIQNFEDQNLASEINGYKERIAELEAQVRNYGSYGDLASLEQQIEQRKQEIQRLVAQPERQRMPASAKAIPEPENDTVWVARVESELEDYLDVLEDRVEWVASWPARNPLPPCSDPENC